MSEINPYQSPQAPSMPPVMSSTLQPMKGGLWREGNLLVMHKEATLPDRCVKSNQPCQRRLRRNLSWHHPAISLSILAGVLIYIILAAILTKKATIQIGLSDEWFSRRRRRIATAWVIVLAGLAMVVLGFSAQNYSVSPLLVFGGFISPLIGLIFGTLTARMVAPKRITDQYVWIKGVHPDFLAELPPMPQEAF